jgi:hypothetical protein
MLLGSSVKAGITNSVPPTTVSAAKYYGLVGDEGFAHSSSGFIQFAVSSKRSVSGKMIIAGDALSFTGKLADDNSATLTISRSSFHKSSLTLSLMLSDDGEQITGTLTAGNEEWIVPFSADRHVWSADSPAPYEGAFTFADPNVTRGATFGLGKVNYKGQVVLTGLTGDRQTLTLPSFISASGQCPVYVPLYKTSRTFVTNGVTMTVKSYNGSLIGWMNFTGTQGDWLSGTLTWNNEDEGFSETLSIVGSLYVRPAAAASAVPAWESGAGIYIDGGPLSTSYSYGFVLGADNKFTFDPADKALRVGISLSTGSFSAGFKEPGTSTVISAKGVILQDVNGSSMGFGNFAGGSYPGVVMLQ